MTSDSKDTLREFVRSRSEEAFRKIVREHSPLVYGTALRKLGGNRAAAQDVTQEVFTLLARKANGLGSVVLGGWLYRQTCRQAANHVRSESRRRQRESQAMELQPDNLPSLADALSGELDDALLTLPETDRNALILRFFEGWEFKALGRELGLSEEAARKRVTRALERLSGNLRRKGIAVGGVSLGTAMQGFGATAVPVSVISVVSEGALKAAGTGGGFGLLALLKPIVAGVVASSLVAGSAVVLRSPGIAENRVAAVSAPRTGSSNPRASRFAERLPKNPSLEQIIAEIRRVLSGPGNALTEFRLKAAIENIQIAQIPQFISLGDELLNEAERDAVYQPLLNSWWIHDRNATMDYVLEMSKRPKSPPNEFLVRSFFSRWESDDFGACIDWLLANWNQPVLQHPAFNEPLRDSLIKSAVANRFHRGDMEGLFRFLERLPEVKDRVTAFQVLTGQDHMHGIMVYNEGRKEQWKQVYRSIESISDEAGRTELARNFWKTVSENHPGDVDKIRKFIEPTEPFLAALGSLLVVSLPSQKIENMAGGTTYHYGPVTDMETRLADAVEIGLTQGLSRELVMEKVTDTLRKRGGEDATEWLGKNSRAWVTDSSLQDLDFRGAAQGTARTWTMKQATELQNAEQRRSVSRGTFRRLLARDSSAAVAYLNDEGVPDDLKAELQTIASETP